MQPANITKHLGYHSPWHDSRSSREKRRLRLLKSILVGTLALLFLSSPAAAQLIVDPDLDVAGKPVVDWIPDWALWTGLEPEATNEMYDETGQFQHLNQHGPVWFLPLDFGVAVQLEPYSRELSFRVPSDKYILASIYLSWSCAFDPDPADHVDWVKASVPRWPLAFSVDGISVSDSKLKSDHRADTELLHYLFPADNPVGEEPLSIYCAVGGYWVTVAPLPPGEHVIEKAEYGPFARGEAFPNGEMQKWIFNITSVLPGDLDVDGDWTAADLNLLSSAIREAANDVYTDVNGDGSLDQADHTYWVDSLAGTFFGDADLNGTVDFTDFLAVSSNFGKPGGWAQGDFDGDGDIAFPDFLLLSSNFGSVREAAATQSVPEPNASVLVLMGCLFGLGRRKRRM